MSTRAQRRAARSNSEKSTGPRTEAGKSSSSLNALRHGLCSRQAILPGEDAQALADISREFYRTTRAVGPLELYCVERMILSFWRMRRIGAMEVEILQAPAEDDEIPNPIATRDKRLSLLIRYETSLQRTYDRAFAELRNLQHMRGSSSEPLISFVSPTIEVEMPETGFVSHTPGSTPLEPSATVVQEAA